jgi:hypothetical protein
MSLRRVIAAVLLSAVASTASAQRVQLDDTLSPVDTFQLPLTWNAGVMRQALAALLADAPDAAPQLTGRIDNVEVRLDTRDFVGQSARIYLTLPTTIAGLSSPTDLELQWDVTNPFIPGAARPGQSMLVFEGSISGAVTSAFFSFAVRLDRGAETDTFDVEPYYELEIIP